MAVHLTLKTAGRRHAGGTCGHLPEAGFACPPVVKFMPVNWLSVDPGTRRMCGYFDDPTQLII